MKELDITVLVNKDNPLDSKYVPLKMYVVDKNENNFHKYKDENPTNAFVGSTKSFESPNGANSIKNNNY